MRKQAFLKTCENDHRKLESLGAMTRHERDARVERALRFAEVRQKRQPIDKSPKRGLEFPALVRSRGRYQLGEIVDASFGFLAALLVQILEVSALIEHFADGN